jgi:AcrR family transcriptional regulator/DNA-binding MarR family transcriptional regulator
MSVARVTLRAGVSRRTFYDLFEDREACFLGVFEDAVARASVIARDAASGQEGWRERVRAALFALLALLEDEPGLGSLLLVEALGAGPNVLAGRTRVLHVLIAIVEDGRSSEARTTTITEDRGSVAEPSSSSSSLMAEGVVGAVLAVIHARVLQRDHPRLLDLLNPLMSMIVLPYLGPRAAALELAHATPRSVSRKPKEPVGDPLQGLDMRLTYRTLRVLGVIAEHPDASNREVAQAAGISDQGQISKLLTRLERLGLVKNSGLGHTQGEPNAWKLTPKGQHVEQAIKTATENHTHHQTPAI